VIQSLNRKHIVDDIVEKYGHIIVDECHHLSAFSFEQVLRSAKARYVLGLTATPIRKDGHHPIIIMQCGPIRYRVNPRIQAGNRPFGHFVVPRFTGFCLPLQTHEPEINEIYSALIHYEQRNEMVIRDLLNVVRQGRTPIVLTERTVHLEHLQSQLTKWVKHVVVFRGGMGAKQRKSLSNQLSDIPDDEGRVLLATGRYLGEGFDYAPLDTLFLAMPISWRGTLHQYVGRLHRLHDQKKEVVVYDYVDVQVPMLLKMFDRRRRGYEAIGYTIGENRLI
jgi:superfamily II DNA or RNA helicase